MHTCIFHSGRGKSEGRGHRSKAVLKSNRMVFSRFEGWRTVCFDLWLCPLGTPRWLWPYFLAPKAAVVSPSQGSSPNPCDTGQQFHFMEPTKRSPPPWPMLSESEVTVAACQVPNHLQSRSSLCWKNSGCSKLDSSIGLSGESQKSDSLRLHFVLTLSLSVQLAAFLPKWLIEPINHTHAFFIANGCPTTASNFPSKHNFLYLAIWKDEEFSKSSSSDFILHNNSFFKKNQTPLFSPVDPLHPAFMFSLPRNNSFFN